MAEQTISLLDEWLASRLNETAQQWLQDRVEKVEAKDLQQLCLGFGLVARKIPKEPFEGTPEELAAAEDAISGWRPQGWSLQDLARTRLVLALQEEEGLFQTTLDRLFAAGEVHELIALYQSLPLFPYPKSHVNRAAEGIRTNMGVVFKAVAHHNPYPAAQLPEGLWNQMILKCLFVEVSLKPVIGIDERKNPALTRMLCDYAHERWAASRTISPELWRCVDPAHDQAALEDLKRVLDQGSERERRAAALSLASSDSPDARKLLESDPHLSEEIASEQVSWENL